MTFREELQIFNTNLIMYQGSTFPNVMGEADGIQ